MPRPDRLGLLLPSPTAVASPTRAAHLVSELAESVAYTHGLEEILVAKSWWSRRICGRIGLAACTEAESPEEVVDESPEIVEALVDGSKPRTPQRLRPGERRLLSYYIDSRRSGVVFLGARRLLAHA